MVEIPTPEEQEPEMRTITSGYFEEELYVDAKSLGAFLVELGEQLQQGEEITITGDGWEIPFTYAGPIELEIEFEGDGQPELEIEIEFDGLRNDKAPSLG